jgi:hypothetical protein
LNTQLELWAFVIIYTEYHNFYREPNYV